MEIKEKLVHIKNDYGEYLVGDITFPSQTADKYPAVLLVHGLAVERDEYGLFSDLSLELSGKGYLVFKFDFSGCGDSEGDFSESSLSKLKSDLDILLRFVKNHPKVNKSKVGIVAQSFGTSVTVALKPAVKAMVLMGSVAHPYEVIKHAFREDFNPEGISSRKRSNGTVTRVKPQFWEDLKKYDLVKETAKIASPILFIHGKKDEKVALSEMEALYGAKKGEKQYIVLKGADHDLKPKREAAYGFIKDWFGKYLKKED